MNIAINTLSLNRTKAGMGNYIWNLVNCLASIDRKNGYYIFVSDRNKHLFDIKRGNFKIIKVGRRFSEGPLRFLWEQFALPKCIKKLDIDILHSPGFVIPFFSKAKNVLTIADLTFIKYPRVHTLIKQKYFGWLIPHSIKKSDRVISISESTKKDILELIDTNPEKIDVIHLAHGKEFNMKNKKNAKNALKTKYGIKPPFLLFVGMIEPRKNLGGVLMALANLKKEGMPHKIVIVGKKGWKYKGVFKTIRELKLGDNVVFTGYVPDADLPIFYNSAEVFMYPCLYEGFGIPILEAMACGCPVITSNISSMPEVAGNAAILVNPESVEEIKQAMKRVISDSKLRADMIRKGMINVKRFNWEKTARETLEVYNSLK